MIREGIWSIKNFSSEALKKYDLFWIGEIHGIRENYKAYKTILPYLAKNGFRNILWEMPSDFSEKSNYTRDGRINPFSIKFLSWLKKQIEAGKIDNLTFFGNIMPISSDAKLFNYEKEMASEIIELVRNSKSVIISGNYHMMNLASKGGGEKSAADFIKEKSNLRILKMYLEYSKGTFYNFGCKKLAEQFTNEKGGLEFGKITRQNDLLSFKMGKVNAVFKNPATG